MAAFVTGLATIVLALASPLDDWAEELQWAHMLQHVLLLLVAPPLLALARPWNRMWRGLPLDLRRRVARRSPRPAGRERPSPDGAVFGRTGAPSRPPFTVTPPPGTFRSPTTRLFDLRWFTPRSTRSSSGTGLLFWTRVIDSPPWRSPLPEGARAVYVASAIVASWLLAIVLALATSPLYAPYAEEATRPAGSPPWRTSNSPRG